MSSKNIYIIYRSMFDSSGKQTGLGGIENYITALAATFKEQGWNCTLVQPSKQNFTVQKDTLTITGVETGLLRGNLKKYALANWVKQHANKAQDVVIFATDSYSVNLKGYNVVAIQHGVSWDKPRKTKSKVASFLASLTNQIKYFSFIKSSHTLVCVDHNFVNWYRTWADFQPNKVKVIYNFFDEKITAEAFEQKWQADDEKSTNIIIARRFVEYRGIKLIIPVIQKLLAKHQNLKVTFAGNGPLQQDLKNAFASSSNVSIEQYEANESFKYHSAHHIAVIPTLGSEGTSLSMIEAMAAGCTVVTSNVGGLSNIIIGEYNGLSVIPDEAQFFNAIDRLISDKSLNRELALSGLQSISTPCSKAHWSKQWVELIRDI
ncbi:glycosyl transferase family 1 [Shewanella sairae]|uniref:Glycosyl transferase family 1 n=1 Tax=Shewanella sairae TaxID=190310 RepID=A0ABQ4PQ01_9GAMM|nr:glycosyltransferase family 4 protein [Shewanella sairae]MCL1130528.1 glycosyltransferase family 4 protein [Shewanella sairae]GIU51042.1 glycosyl transferase family 1 [Shewanella sairae]